MTHSEQNPLANVGRGLGENMRPDVVDAMAPRGAEGREEAEIATKRLKQSLDVETDTEQE
jgi:hypothetical protein